MAEDQATPVCAETIQFPNGNEARLVKAGPSDKIDDLLAALEVTPARMLIVVVGGGDKLDEQVKPRLKQVFGRAIARAAGQRGAVILDGGTQSGVMELLGIGVAANRSQMPLIGVAPAGCVTYPGHDEGASRERTPLDANHTHFLLSAGDAWGSETSLLFQAAEVLGRDKPILTILVNGGEIAKREVLQTVRRGWPVLAIRGTGRLADQVAALDGQDPGIAQDPVLAEIQAEGRITVVGIDDDLGEIERVVTGRSPEDRTLALAWRRFREYDLAASRSQKRFQRSQMSILTLGVFATLLAITHSGWPARDAKHYIVKMVLQFVMIITPIVISMLVAWVNRFRPGNKWVLLRAAAEAVKRETFFYRTRAGAYGDAQCRQVSREVKLAQEIERISVGLQQTEVHSSVIPTAPQPANQNLGSLTTEDYLRERVQDQIAYMQRKTKVLEFRLQALQWGVLLLGGAGTLLAAIGRNVWIALTTALAAAITTKLETDQVETSLIQYNQAHCGLLGVQGWWNALTEWEKNCQQNIDLLVDHTEKILGTEVAGWVQHMQNALVKLRQQQTERESKDQRTPPAT